MRHLLSISGSCTVGCRAQSLASAEACVQGAFRPFRTKQAMTHHMEYIDVKRLFVMHVGTNTFVLATSGNQVAAL